ncbi:biogenesis of lysosome-related organelles complex-1 subunit 2-domain-containing protein [Sporodiniella umbellata]|nr:biogenesis of lysosome-related organelles complex-1 subunit 2-domain-containing protein [Sporodiniella umbellata]
MMDKRLKPDEYAKGLDQEHIIKLTEDACKHFAEYTKAELKVTVEDCQLLESMNNITKEKYKQMNQMSERLMKEVTQLETTYNDLGSFMDQVEEIHEQSIKIENTIHSLDEYSKFLETKLNQHIPSLSKEE